MRSSRRWPGTYFWTESTRPPRAAFLRAWISSPIPGSGWTAGPAPKTGLEGARINVLTTKVDRNQALAGQTALLNALREVDGRVNLSWGSNTIV
jgi:hypothetical protein